jgi:hypothetical protein
VWILISFIWSLDAITQYDFGSHVLKMAELLSAKYLNDSSTPLTGIYTSEKYILLKIWVRL